MYILQETKWEKSPVLTSIWTHNPLITSGELYHCAATTAKFRSVFDSRLFSAFEKVSISSRDHWFIEGSIFEGTSKLIWPRWGGERWIENNGQKNLFLFLKTRKGIEMEQKTQKENVWESACVCVCPYMCVCVFVFTRVFVLWVCAWERETERERDQACFCVLEMRSA